MSDIPPPMPKQEWVSEIRPWVRLTTRLFDQYLLCTSILVFLVVLDIRGDISLSKQVIPPQAAMAVGLLFWILYLLIDSILLCTLGTTPGRAIFRSSLTNQDGSKLSWYVAHKRSLTVWWRGFGLGIFPIVTLITFCVASYKLHKNGRTSWDERWWTMVQHRKIGIWRGLLIAVIFSPIPALLILTRLFSAH